MIISYTMDGLPIDDLVFRSNYDTTIRAPKETAMGRIAGMVQEDLKKNEHLKEVAERQSGKVPPPLADVAKKEKQMLDEQLIEIRLEALNVSASFYETLTKKTIEDVVYGAGLIMEFLLNGKYKPELNELTYEQFAKQGLTYIDEFRLHNKNKGEK